MEDLTGIFSLQGRCALVTGGGSGIARQVAGALAQFGAVVGVMDIDEGKASDTVAEIRSMGLDATRSRVMSPLPGRWKRRLAASCGRSAAWMYSSPRPG